MDCKYKKADTVLPYSSALVGAFQMKIAFRKNNGTPQAAY